MSQAQSFSLYTHPGFLLKVVYHRLFHYHLKHEDPRATNIYSILYRGQFIGKAY